MKFACKRPKNNQLAVGAPMWWLFLSNDNVITVISECKHINDTNIIVNSGISPSANVMAAAKKWRVTYIFNYIVYLPREWNSQSPAYFHFETLSEIQNHWPSGKDWKCSNRMDKKKREISQVKSGSKSINFRTSEGLRLKYVKVLWSGPWRPWTGCH